VVAIDNFANSVTETDGESAALKRVEQITGKKVTFYNCDLLDREKLETVFNEVICYFRPTYIMIERAFMRFRLPSRSFVTSCNSISKDEENLKS
jgi:hypothetical protein